ncbi:urease accessory protein UreF [Cellulomonas sp. C5510]|nr:urease accessory protein UreF [Cellulomonas sp. C5510]
MLALLADARLPTGAHTQSGSLEPALRGGLRPDQVPAFLTARLRTVVRVEAGVAVVARHVAAHPDGAAAAGLVAVWRHWEARTPSRALRDSSVRLGRGQQRLLTGLWPEHPGVGALSAAVALRRTADRSPSAGHPPRPLVVGVTAACAGLSGAQTARLVAYDDAQTVAAATLKLAPLDPVETIRWVVDARDDIETLVAEVRDLTDAARIPASGAPLIEQWAETHARTDERLFSA